MLKAITVQGRLAEHTIGATDAEAIAHYLNGFTPFKLPANWDELPWYDVVGQALWVKVQSAYQATLVSVDIKVLIE